LTPENSKGNGLVFLLSVPIQACLA